MSERHFLAVESEQRLARTQAELSGRGLGGLLAYANGAGESAGTIRYLTGWMPTTTEALLLVPAQGRPELISAEKNRARAFGMVLDPIATVIKTTDLARSLAAVLERWEAGAPLATAGWFDLTLSRHDALAAVLQRLHVVDGEPIVTGLRVHRSSLEAARQQRATDVADAMVQHAMRLAAVPHITGMELMSEVEFLGRRLGADRASCWLALGSRPAETYFETFELALGLGPGERLQIGTTVLVDGYFSQVLRIGVLGEPSAHLREIGAQLIEAQDAALKVMAPGAPVTIIGDTLEAEIDKLCPYARAEDPFRFQSCHALGNSYSEPWSAPFLNAERDRADDDRAPAIGPNQTFEIHPNFTLPALGHVCAGDVALITDAGGQWISTTPRGVLRIG